MVMRRRSAALAVAGLTMLGGVTWSPTPAAATAITVPADFPTIQAALDAAGPGDTVSVAPGTYNERIDFRGKDITLVGTGGASATTIAAPGGTAVSIGPEATIRGFTITGGTASFGAGMAVNGIGTMVTMNAFVGDQEGSGGYGAAIGGNNASPTITRNLFADNSCDTQWLSGVVAFVNSSEPQIVDNVFRDNPCAALNLALPAGQAPRVVNNTIVHNSIGYRTIAQGGLAGGTVRNNVIVGNLVGLQADYGSPPTWDHNLVQGNTTDFIGVPDPTGTNGNVSADPRFADAAADDYHLSATSPAIGAGSAVFAPTLDFDGNPRPSAAVDLGAYQYSPLVSHTTFACRIRAVDGSYVSAEVAGVGDGYGVLRARASVSGAWERFRCEALPDGHWALRSRHNWRLATVDPTAIASFTDVLRVRARTIGPSESYKVKPVAGCVGCVALRSVSAGRFVTAELGASEPWRGVLRARADRVGPWETFLVLPDPS